MSIFVGRRWAANNDNPLFSQCIALGRHCVPTLKKVDAGRQDLMDTPGGRKQCHDSYCQNQQTGRCRTVMGIIHNFFAIAGVPFAERLSSANPATLNPVDEYYNDYDNRCGNQPVLPRFSQQPTSGQCGAYRPGNHRHAEYSHDQPAQIGSCGGRHVSAYQPSPSSRHSTRWTRPIQQPYHRALTQP